MRVVQKAALDGVYWSTRQAEFLSTFLSKIQHTPVNPLFTCSSNSMLQLYLHNHCPFQNTYWLPTCVWPPQAVQSAPLALPKPVQITYHIFALPSLHSKLLLGHWTLNFGFIYHPNTNVKLKQAEARLFIFWSKDLVSTWLLKQAQHTLIPWIHGV